MLLLRFDFAPYIYIYIYVGFSMWIELGSFRFSIFYSFMRHLLFLLSFIFLVLFNPQIKWTPGAILLQKQIIYELCDFLWYLQCNLGDFLYGLWLV